MSSNIKNKRTLIIGLLVLVSAVGVVWALRSTGDSAPAHVVSRPVTDDPAIDSEFDEQDVAVRSAAQTNSGRDRLEGDAKAGANIQDEKVAAVEKKSKRRKKSRRRKSSGDQDDEEEAATATNKAPRPPYGK
jgi:hypothetical protein